MGSRLIAVFVFLMAGCSPAGPGASLPATTRSTVRVMDFKDAVFESEKDQISSAIPAAPAEVWAVLSGVFEQVGIPVTGSVPETMTMSSSGFKPRRLEGRRMGRYLDCGVSPSGVRANTYDITLSVATRVEAAPEGGSVVTTILEAWARPRVTRGDAVRCLTKGELERRLMELVAENLGLNGSESGPLGRKKRPE